ncbi:uncharacterized protein B0H64DRAFT_410914 [Chaetomium fimeti]|uniref:F-box domain-containing protein n=1 Tax=Chaetomium fimeti TaxID=1854472 RepID=A0AAE0LMT3_9PEZI|nr:hypothetical protein B0H64DRAFT_410914 [Chaetomium fimeti]
MDQGQEKEQSSPVARSNCTLELLPTEVLVAILSSARSTVDLHALIHASPRLYQVFVSAKREVLLSIVATDLGQGLRDAVAVLLIAPTKLDYREPTYFEECERIIHRYEDLPRGYRQLTSASGLTIDTVIALSHLNRTVQFFVDDYAESRFPELHAIHPGAANPLTTTERRRLAKALLRHQLLARFEGGSHPQIRYLGPGQPLPPKTVMMHRFLALFPAWETEQLAQAHGYLNEPIWRAFPRPWSLGYVTEPGQPRDPSRDRRRNAAIYDLDMLRRALLAERERERTQPSPLYPKPTPSPPGQAKRLLARFRFLDTGPLPVMDGASYRVQRELWDLRDELYRKEEGLPRLVAGNHGGGDVEDEAAPPFGWVDAHGGLDCRRWGDQVWREAWGGGEDETTRHQRGWARMNMDRWRWLGFVFWDRARVELLTTPTPTVPADGLGWLAAAAYGTGWLAAAPPADEELRERYDRGRSPPRRLPRRRGNAATG